MKTAVRFHSRTGNTRKLAEAIAGVADVEALNIGRPLKEPVDLLFLGGAVYVGSIDSRLRAFAELLTPDLVKCVAVFGTSAEGKSPEPALREILEAGGIRVADKSFLCSGRFLLMNRGKPDLSDRNAAMDFARELLSQQL